MAARSSISAPLRALAAALLAWAGAAPAGSICYGTPANGRLEGGVQLPVSGPNFSAYASLGVELGRTYVHPQVRDIVAAAYAALEKSAPGKSFIYGEAGWESGGRMRPHRTHQNGTSVDFMVPLLDAAGHVAHLPASALNQFGYAYDFDDQGRYENYTIDFEAIGEHLFQLQQAAQQHGAAIALIIFDLRYMDRLFATSHGQYLKEKLPFLLKDPWIRHDEHYHVDFAIKCEPLRD